MQERKWWQDDKGNMSSMRLIVVPSALIGQMVVISGTIAMFLGIPEGVSAMGVGAAMIATAQGAKAWQKQAENKEGA
jgi:hypothetical protein